MRVALSPSMVGVGVLSLDGRGDSSPVDVGASSSSARWANMTLLSCMVTGSLDRGGRRVRRERMESIEWWWGREGWAQQGG